MRKMKNCIATKAIYGLKPGTEILNELRGFYARIDGWSGNFYYATELNEDGNIIDGDMIECGKLHISPIDLIGCEIFEEE